MQLLFGNSVLFGSVIEKWAKQQAPTRPVDLRVTLISNLQELKLRYATVMGIEA